MHLNVTGKALVIKQIVNYVNSILNQKEEKPICVGWKADDVYTVDVKKAKQDCSSIGKSNLGKNTSSVNDVNGRKVNCNQVCTSMQEEISGQATDNLVTSKKQSCPKHTATIPAVNRISSRIRNAPVTKGDAFSC
jgi:hypothetical protein